MKCLALVLVLLCIAKQSFAAGPPRNLAEAVRIAKEDLDEVKEAELEELPRDQIERKLAKFEHHLDQMGKLQELQDKGEFQMEAVKAHNQIDSMMHSDSLKEFRRLLRGLIRELKKILKTIRQGSLGGDPHFMTFDGHRYDFQGLCWYTLVKDCSSVPDFDVKGRFEERYIDPEVKTRTVEVMITAGTETINLKEDNSIYVDGKPLISNDQLKNMKVIKEDDEIIVTLPGLKVMWSGPNHQLSNSISDPLKEGSLCGLLGDADGDPDNDFRKSDGYQTDDVDDFANSWKVFSMTC
ncbi:BMP-binding endothelial regulator protein-like [Ptychodera flava]|uniref:BMP-binding endothelial regulator protein-like n=1 Tax=Ptychodera flava TaxID=63121 RepID=UPI00396A6ED3